MNKIKYKLIYVILIIYAFLEIFLSHQFGSLYDLVINPAFFIIFTIFINCYFGILRCKSKNDKENLKNMLIAMLIYFILYECLGLIFGFVYNPYSRTIIGMLKNIWKYIVPICLIEYIRGYIIDKNKKNNLALILITIIIFLIEINLNNLLFSGMNGEKIFIYISATAIPLLANQMLYTYICRKSNFKSTVVLRTVNQAIILFVPILPDLDWFKTGIIGILFPVILYLSFKYYFDKKSRYVKRRNIKKSSPIAFVPVLLFVILLSGFMIGIFNYKPIAIASNSMNPLFYRGDAVVMRKIDDISLKNVKKSDIIIFIMEEKIVIHRVIDIEENDGVLYFQTQGDNNPSPDAVITPEDKVLGVYITHIKYIGYPSIWLSELFSKSK